MSSALVSRQRGGKLLNVFEIIRFPNSGCNSTTVGNTYGVCYTATECAGLGGTSSGPCCLETSWATADDDIMLFVVWITLCYRHGYLARKALSR